MNWFEENDETEPGIYVDDGVEIIDLLPIARLVHEQAGFVTRLTDREAAGIARERFFVYGRYPDPGVEPKYDLKDEDELFIKRIRDWAMWYQAAGSLTAPGSKNIAWWFVKNPARQVGSLLGAY